MKNVMPLKRYLSIAKVLTKGKGFNLINTKECYLIMKLWSV